jgi:hypothetical protein
MTLDEKLTILNKAIETLANRIYNAAIQIDAGRKGLITNPEAITR